MKSDYGHFYADDPNPFLEDEPPPTSNNHCQFRFTPTSVPLYLQHLTTCTQQSTSPDPPPTTPRGLPFAGVL